MNSVNGRHDNAHKIVFSLKIEKQYGFGDARVAINFPIGIHIISQKLLQN